jgi:hypothetical protein
MNQDYLAVNKELWNQKTPIHLKSDFYEVEAFRKGKTSLKPIELALLEVLIQWVLKRFFLF